MVSIVVPVHNAAGTLAVCVDSLLRQTMREIEVVLVENGSEDDSGARCDAYAALDARVKVLHMGKDGVSAARNAGIAAATGDFLCFVDADDYVDDDFAEQMAGAMADGAEIVFCGLACEYVDSGHRQDYTVDTAGTYRDRTGVAEAVYQLDAHPLLLNSATNKLYRLARVRAQGLAFQRLDGTGEDLLFVLDYMPGVEAVALVKAPLSHYVQHAGPSLVRRHYGALFETGQMLNERRRALYERLGLVADTAQTRLARACFGHDFQVVTSLYRHGQSIPRAERLAAWRKLRGSDTVRQDVRLAGRFGPEASLFRLALCLPPWFADALFRCVMGLRGALGSVYRAFRDRVLLRSK